MGSLIKRFEVLLHVHGSPDSTSQDALMHYAYTRALARTSVDESSSLAILSQISAAAKYNTLHTYTWA